MSVPILKSTPIHSLTPNKMLAECCPALKNQTLCRFLSEMDKLEKTFERFEKNISNISCEIIEEQRKNRLINKIINISDHEAHLRRGPSKIYNVALSQLREAKEYFFSSLGDIHINETKSSIEHVAWPHDYGIYL